MQTFWLLNPNAMTAKFNLAEAATRWAIAAGGALLVFESAKTIIKLRKKDEAALEKRKV